MPSAQEYRAYEAQARKDEAEFREWAESRPDVERKRLYEQWADNRLSHADWYREQYERLERVK